jgi:hypothetical protein
MGLRFKDFSPGIDILKRHSELFFDSCVFSNEN